MKIAVIIVGIFEFNENILKEICRCYSLNESNTDIFLYNNNSIEDNKKILNYFKNKNINCISIKSCKYIKSNINNKENIINEKIKNNWDDFKKVCIQENIINNNKISYHVPIKNINFFHPHVTSPQQYEQIYLALNEIEKYEKEKNMEYDFIMKIRLDFYLKHDKFGPIHYFNDSNNILLKSYNNLKYYYDKISEDDNYHSTEFRINNYLYWRTAKYLGGQFILNKDSYNCVKDQLNNRKNFNQIIKEKFVITINDACFFSSGINFKKFIKSLYNQFGEFYDPNIKFWWTAECQFQLSILNNDLYYFDYLQNNNYYKGREMWVNDYHGIEKYNHQEMKTD